MQIQMHPGGKSAAPNLILIVGAGVPLPGSSAGASAAHWAA